ncbi:uncharacterized [Tachysurus ichikawai]
MKACKSYLKKKEYKEWRLMHLNLDVERSSMCRLNNKGNVYHFQRLFKVVLDTDEALNKGGSSVWPSVGGPTLHHPSVVELSQLYQQEVTLSGPGCLHAGHAGGDRGSRQRQSLVFTTRLCAGNG